MNRLLVIAAISFAGVGCRAPMPSWSALTPPGATRVPPPPTGGYGVQQPYYAPAQPAIAPSVPPTAAPVGTGFRPAANANPNRWSNINDPANTPNTNGATPAPTGSKIATTRTVDLKDVDVALANHETNAIVPASSLVVENDGPIRIISSDSTSPSPTPNRLRGMAVSDLTKPSAPKTFVPTGRVIDISELPDTPITVSPTKTSTSANGSANAAWTTRTTALRVAGA